MKGPLPNVIVTCTARKTLPVSVEVGSLTNTYPDQRFDEWTRKLEPSSSTVKTAKDLYAGSSWSPVREIIDSARANVWIASAGYGLITPATSILSYSATFTRNHPDFVGADDVKNGAQNWWSKLTARNIKREPISSISELVRQNPDIPLIASLSEDYWAALKSDFEGEAAGTDTFYPLKGTPVLFGSVSVKAIKSKMPALSPESKDPRGKPRGI